MCECGCTTGLDRYRMPGPKGVFYIVEIYPGCQSCPAPPGVTIYKVDKNHHLWEELQTDDWAQPMPWNKWDGGEEVPIKVGLDMDEFRKVLSDELVTYVADLKKTAELPGRFHGKPRWLDKEDAWEIGEQVWLNGVFGEVSLVKAEKKTT